jgi:hypothetical protein
MLICLNYCTSCGKIIHLLKTKWLSYLMVIGVIACYDAVVCSAIEQLGGKQMVMQLLSHDDPNVKYEALLAVQKLMVHNWWVPLR